MEFQEYGYRSVAKSAGPYQLAMLTAGVKSCVEGLAQVKAGEEVLILTDYEIDPVVVQAFVANCSYLGAKVHILHTRPFSLGGKDENNPSDLVVAAYKAADVVFSLCWFPDIHTKKMPQHLSTESNTRWVSLYQMATVECLSSPAASYPLPILFELTKKMRDICLRTQEIRVTSPEGTDLKFKVKPENVSGGAVGPLGIGGWTRAAFPLSALGIFPPIDAEGVICSCDNYVTGFSDVPIRLDLKENMVYRISGGGPGEAEAILKYLQGPKKTNRFPLIEAQWGLNPKARIKGATQIEQERLATTLHFGVGTEYHQHKHWDTHNDFGIPTPTLYFDGVALVKDRRLSLLEDPDIRAIAAQFGDPDALLTCNPYI
jgi:2,5-dihydroxypyridine 5,6-dioxygenase